ncbi:MAG: cysteine desulfurase-like protein [Emcibacteraceae bacterium]|nr:cysteine desulfurase-like protein [Emcibacteraceae bacterium]MDG1997316.1 cysteine desulfurase-like protein [Emcibacteraceae bacterium]
MALDMNFVRDQFPGLKNEWTFMDNAGGSQILKGCVDNITEYYYSNNVQLGGSYDVSQNALKAYSQGREKIATLFNASRPEEIVFGPSSTVLLQFLSKSLASQLQAGDEVIVTITDHESNIGPWVWLEEKGVVIKFWPMNKETYELELDALDALMTDKTKLVAFTHVSNMLGTINNVKEITKFVHDRGALVCVDAVAYAPHRAVDVQDWDVDFYALSLYKIYGPHHAALYCRYDHIAELDGLYHYFYGKDKIPAKMEPGNANYELSYGAGAIVDYLATLGEQAGAKGSTREKLEAAYDDITEQENILCEQVLSYLRKRNDCHVVGITDGLSPRRVPTIAFTVQGKDPEQICLAMDKYKVAIRFGDFHARRLSDSLDLTKDNGTVRISLTHYNTVEEVAKLTAALDEVLSE